MLIGKEKLDDVELMFGRRVVAERMEIEGMVSLFDFSKENQQLIKEWEDLPSIMVNPEEFNWNMYTNRDRNHLLTKVENYVRDSKQV